MMIKPTDMPRLWERLTRPAATLTDERHRLRARLIASMVLLVIIASALILLSTYTLLDGVIVSPKQSTVWMLMGGVGLLAYSISRTRHYVAAIYILLLLSWSNTIGGFLYMQATIGATTSSSLYFLLIPVLIGGVFLRLRAAMLISGVNIGLVLLLGALFPAYRIIGPLIFNLILSPLVLLAFYQFRIMQRGHEAYRQMELMKSRLLSSELANEHELNELKDKFISTVSHEFRTPLATILSSSEILQLYGHRLDDAKRELYFGKINSQVQHLAQMVEEVLTISKVSSGTIGFAPEPADLNALCRDLLRNCVMEHHPAIIFESDLPDDTRLVVDQTLVEGALRQLLVNAVKYSPSNSDIHLRVTCRDGDTVFQVCDQGMGIPLEDQPRIFDSFQRGHNVQHIPGTGLGLRIADEYAQLHGGRITFESHEGDGTIFTMALPILDPAYFMDG